jgi:hypothetical protein
MEARREGEVKGGRGWQQQGRTTTTVPFLQQSNCDKKSLKKHDNQPPKQRRRAQLVAGKGADVLRLMGVGFARDEAKRVEQ